MRITVVLIVFCFKQKTAYEMRISDWSSDVCSSDLPRARPNRSATTYESCSPPLKLVVSKRRLCAVQSIDSLCNQSCQQPGTGLWPVRFRSGVGCQKAPAASPKWRYPHVRRRLVEPAERYFAQPSVEDTRRRQAAVTH